jgi:predicted alpha/beta-hydrolase family hydrolase
VAGVACNWPPPGLRSLVLFDGRPDQVANHLARVRLPTLIVAGRCDERVARRYRDAGRAMSAPHRVLLLPQRTGALPAAGAHEAFVHEALDWLARTLPQPQGLAHRP